MIFMKFYGLTPNPLIFVNHFQTMAKVTENASIELVFQSPESILCESNDMTTPAHLEPVTKNIQLSRLGCISEVYIIIERWIKKICLSEFEN